MTTSPTSIRDRLEQIRQRLELMRAAEARSMELARTTIAVGVPADSPEAKEYVDACTLRYVRREEFNEHAEEDIPFLLSHLATVEQEREGLVIDLTHEVGWRQRAEAAEAENQQLRDQIANLHTQVKGIIANQGEAARRAAEGE
jgi:hypothetical protein